MSDQIEYNYQVVLFNSQGFHDLDIPVKTLARAQTLAGFWPWRSSVERRAGTLTKQNSVAVKLVRGTDEMTVWVWNSQLAARLCFVWESQRRARTKFSAKYTDYTLSCLCGGKTVIGGAEGRGVCSKCHKPPRFARYTGPWNPPGGIFLETAAEARTRTETKGRKAETKGRKAETKGRKAETCEIQVVNRHESDFTVYIGRGTPYGNPYKAAELGRKTALERFERYARTKLMDVIAALPHDAVLGCSCKPKPCHGDIIVKLWREIHGQTKKPKAKPRSAGTGWQSLL